MPSPPTLIGTATRARNWVLLLAFLVSFITYIDRVCISAAAPAMTEDLGLTRSQMAYVFSAFSLAYGIFEIPMGWLGDRYGQRLLLTRIVASWSIFTILTGMANSFAVLFAIRFLFGAAEAGAFPTLARALARWFPFKERGRINGLMWMGARLGGSVAPPVAAWLIGLIGWRESFAVFGVIGLVWCWYFWRWYRDDPADHPSVNQAELAYITEGRVEPAKAAHFRLPWAAVFSSVNLWAMFGMYFCSAFGFFFFVTWLPTYLVEEYGLTLARSGLYSALPLGAGAIGCYFGGALSDWLIARTGNVKWGRRLVGMAGFLLSALGYAMATQATTPLSAVLCLAFAQGAHDLTLAVAWATCLDVGGRYGGTTTGFMNTASSMSAMISPIAAAWLAETFGTFQAMFAAATVVYVIGALAWLRIDATEPLRGTPDGAGA